MHISHDSICVLDSLHKRFRLLLCFLLATCLVFSFPIEKAEAKSNGVLVVAIDPGHGGGEAGAHANGVNEEEANWDIAVACVNELNTYSGVKAVFTKSNDQYMNREERIDSAVNQGADIVVSIHCNSASAPSANGSEVWIPNESAYLYNETHVVGKGVGDSILRNLSSSCGLYNRGVKTRNCTDGETYPSLGGLCDWYGINYWARWKGICGIIVEHAFVTNGSDASKLASSEWRTRMGQADAKGIAELLYRPQEMCFKQAAREFRLIEDSGVGIIVNFGDSLAMVERLKQEGPSYSLLKQLAQYTVSVHRRYFERLRSILTEEIEGIYVARDREQYSPAVGLTMENHWLEEILIK